MIASAFAVAGLVIGGLTGIGSDSPVSQLATAESLSLPSTSLPSTPPAAEALTATSSTLPPRPTPTVAPPRSSTTTPAPPPSTTTTTVVLDIATAAAPDAGRAPPIALATPPSPVDVGTEALGLVRYDWQSRFGDWEIAFEGAREGLRALTYPRDRRIEVFVRPDDSAASIHRVLAHELGHLVDVEINTNADRDRWRRQRRIGDAVSWWPSESEPDFATGAGDFAEAFAVWETGVTSHSTVAGQPSAADLALLHELVTDG
ncbi:MAG: hypothetical protein HKO87_02155 [Acidimicrobiia bacterium]|nr:hypothetical protein [Acidimicrobiia bacterium]